MVCAIGIVPMSRRRRVCIVGIASTLGIAGHWFGRISRSLRTSRAGPRCGLPRRACLALVRYHWPVTRRGGAGTRCERSFSSGKPTEPL